MSDGDDIVEIVVTACKGGSGGGGFGGGSPNTGPSRNPGFGGGGSNPRQDPPSESCDTGSSLTDAARIVGTALQVGGDIATGAGIVLTFIVPPVGAAFITGGRVANGAGTVINVGANLVDGDLGGAAVELTGVAGGATVRRAATRTPGILGTNLTRNGRATSFQGSNGKFISNAQAESINASISNKNQAKEFAAEQIGSKPSSILSQCAIR